MSKSSLVNVNIPAYEGNFTYGRDGRKIEAITIHHVAGVISVENLGQIWQTPGREGSSHYGIGNDGRIGQYVDEENTAWCNSNWDSNCKSVTIETSNCSTGGDWPVSDEALNSLIRLVADIAKRNNLGELVKGKNLTWHSMFTNTECPGPYLMSKLDYIISEANKINFTKPELTYQEIDKKSIKLKINTCLWDLTFNDISKAQCVQGYNAGDVIDNIVAIATHPCGHKYYITEYSYANHIENGFNVLDCEDLNNEPKNIQKFAIGTKVKINGNLYVNAKADQPSGYVNNKITTITRYAEGCAHPYNTTGDLGWMNECDIQEYTIITYTVQEGDTLEGIASKYGMSWQQLYAKNKFVIGNNPNIIIPGQVLTI